MKATELMIGDWVDWYRSPLLREDGHYYDKVIALDRYEQECNPILLTPEILEKNGWETHGNVQVLHRSHSGVPVWLEWRDDNKSLFITDSLIPQPICNVHQMQHILRICGLDNLADNFKI